MMCDKCLQDVELGNDAVALHFLMEIGRLPEGLDRFAYGARHLLPVEGCEGSPSRAQYLEGQLRDTRGYPYVPENEQPWREAYARLQELAIV